MIIIFGGISLDFIFTKDKFINSTSNPSIFTYRVGGVGFNIFNHLNCKDKIFVSVSGNDEFSNIINKELNKKNYKVVFDNDNLSFNLLDNTTSVLLYRSSIFPTSIYNVLMEKGECLIATSDFRIIENELNFEKIKNLLDKLSEKDICVLDSNINPQELYKVIKELKTKNCKIFFETISIEKTKRCKDLINNIFLTTPDILEFNELIDGYDSVYEFMEKKKIEFILKTEGSNGSILYKRKTKEEKRFLPKKVLKLKDTTGAGDFLFSKILESFYNGFSIEKSIEISMEKVLDYLILINEKIDSR